MAGKASLDDFEPIMGAAAFAEEDPEESIARARKAEQVYARSAAKARGVTMSSLGGTKARSVKNELPGSNLMDAMHDTKSLSKAAQLFAKAGLTDHINNAGKTGNFVVFAPSNKAFAAMPKRALAALERPGNEANLLIAMRRHLAKADPYADDVNASAAFDDGTFEIRDSEQPGTQLSVQYRKNTDDATPYALAHDDETGDLQASAAFSGATLSFHDIPGKIHVVDSVIMPE